MTATAPAPAASTTLKQAWEMASQMRRSCGRIWVHSQVVTEVFRTSHTHPEPWREKVDPYIEFTGPSGGHRLFLCVSSPARIWAHWRGFCEANGVAAPQAGQTVHFRGMAEYTGKVVRVTERRALVAFHYRDGRPSQRWLSLGEVSWTPRKPAP